MNAYTDLTVQGTPTRAASVLTGISRATASRRQQRPGPPVPREVVPANRLSRTERARVLAVLTSDEFVDATPIQIFAELLDRGIYLCSVSTMYRVLRENTLVTERRRQARHPARAIPELVATAPGQVYSWDITKLPGPVRGVYYDAYVMIDIYSRYLVGVHVHARESGPLAEEMMREVFAIHGIPEVVHADRGTSMTSKTVATLLADLEVTRSHSRPKVSNDNPYSEAWFKTLKYAPVFPDRFGSLSDARAFMDAFRDRYNHEHHHGGLGLHTPAEVHYGLAAAKAADRADVLNTARNAHPERFSTPTAVPKILTLPDASLDQQARQPRRPAGLPDRRLTPTGLIHLDKFRRGAGRDVVVLDPGCEGAWPEDLRNHSQWHLLEPILDLIGPPGDRFGVAGHGGSEAEGQLRRR